MSRLLFSFLNSYDKIFSEVEIMKLNEFFRIGDCIRKHRKECGFSQIDMAKMLGIAHSTYSNYENNNRTPNMDMLYKISKILNIDINNLFITGPNPDVYFEFVDIFLDWANLRGYSANFSHDDSIFLNNAGAQSIYIFADTNKIEFTPHELNSYRDFLYSYFDTNLMLKNKEQRKDNPPQEETET